MHQAGAIQRRQRAVCRCLDRQAELHVETGRGIARHAQGTKHRGTADSKPALARLIRQGLQGRAGFGTDFGNRKPHLPTQRGKGGKLAYLHDLKPF